MSMPAKRTSNRQIAIAFDEMADRNERTIMKAIGKGVVPANAIRRDCKSFENDRCVKKNKPIKWYNRCDRFRIRD